MATTAQEIFKLAMGLQDELEDNGTINATNTMNYSVKTPGILTILQTELIQQGDLFKTHQISHMPVDNLFGYRYGFEVKAFTGTDQTLECPYSAKAYYFEVDGDCTVYVEDYTGSWNTLETLAITPTESGFTAYKGIVTPTSGATKSRLRFSGTFYYRLVNTALYGVPFATDNDVPDYRPWIKKTMPDDFKSVNEIVHEEVERYSQASTYKWEGMRDLYMNYYFKGNIRVVYRPIPLVVSALTDTMQVDDVTARKVLPYGLAAHLLLNENPSVAAYFNDRYEEMKFIETKRPPAAFEQIEDVYGDMSRW